MTRSITIGNFDGIHLGHQKLIELCKGLARSGNHKSALVSFEPHPTEFFQPGNSSIRIWNAEQKERACSEMGLDECIFLDFDAQLASLSPHDFFEKIIVNQLQTRALVVGQNFCFGRNREGTIALLEELCSAGGIEFRSEPIMNFAGRNISSSNIRNAVMRDGDVQYAASVLGRPFQLNGSVIEGKKLGRTIGFPTFNLAASQSLIPYRGVYFCLAHMFPGEPEQLPPICLPHHRWDASQKGSLVPVMTNIGLNPTTDVQPAAVPGEPLHARYKIESHALHASKQHAENTKYMILHFLKRHRDEMVFGGLEELKAQLIEDKKTATSFFGETAS
jgi:riboflavin kinase/FMN adenylyltransferase